MSTVILQIYGLEKSFYLHAQNKRLRAVSDCSFTVHAGSITALTGPSGAGKSSILKCIYRSYRPSAGELVFNLPEGKCDLAQASDHEVLAIRRQHLGFVTQFLHCLPRKSAVDVVAEPLKLLGESLAGARDQARELLAALGVTESLWNLPPATFSGGEKQRVNIARGFIRKSRLLLLDEPTASLDAVSAQRVVALIQRAQHAGTAIIGIWHDLSMVDHLVDHKVHIGSDIVV